MTGQVISVSHFNPADSVAKLMNVPQENTYERLSLRLLYNVHLLKNIADNIPQTHVNAISHTAYDVELGYKIFKNTAEDFFASYPGYNADMDAVVTAAMCGQKTAKLHPIKNDDPAIVSVRETFNASVRENALAFWREATMFQTDATKPEQYRPESLYLIHVYGLQDLDLTKRNFRHLDQESAKRILSNNVKSLADIARKNTNIGNNIETYVNGLNEEYQARFGQVKHPERSAGRPVLRVITSAPNL